VSHYPDESGYVFEMKFNLLISINCAVWYCATRCFALQHDGSAGVSVAGRYILSGKGEGIFDHDLFLNTQVQIPTL
jgi:hypothetical protein